MYNYAGRKMPDPDGRVGGVAMLAAGTRASKIFNRDICLFNLHDIKFLAGVKSNKNAINQE